MGLLEMTSSILWALRKLRIFKLSLLDSKGTEFKHGYK